MSELAEKVLLARRSGNGAPVELTRRPPFDDYTNDDWERQEYARQTRGLEAPAGMRLGTYDEWEGPEGVGSQYWTPRGTAVSVLPLDPHERRAEYLRATRGHPTALGVAMGVGGGLVGSVFGPRAAATGALIGAGVGLGGGYLVRHRVGRGIHQCALEEQAQRESTPSVKTACWRGFTTELLRMSRPA